MTIEQVPYIGGGDKCPICGYPQICPCSSCVAHISTIYKRWIWAPDDSITCANCGFTTHIDYWLDWAWNCYKLKTTE